MSYQDQYINFMNNPFNSFKDPHHKQTLIEQTDQNLEKSNATTVNTRDSSNSFQQQITQKLPKKIKPSLNSKPSQLPPCFNHLPQPYNTSALDQSIQDQCTVTKKRPRKPVKQMTSETDQQIQSLSVIKQQKTDEKPNTFNQSDYKIQTESAQVSATVLAKSNLRQKFGHLLPPSHQRTLSSEQQQLINVMSMIDQTIDYWIKNRNAKTVFFSDLKKSIRDSLKVIIDFKHLEQLLYLDESLYELRWEKSRDLKKYDIIMKTPEIKSRQERKNNLREIIVAFLNNKHEEFLKAKGITNFSDNRNWHDEFLPHNYEIPRLPLPPHPQTRSAQIRCLDDSKINAIKNEKVRELFKSEKERNEIRSFAKQQSSMQMIFSGTSAEVLEQRLVAAVKQREEQNKIKLELEARYVEKEKSEVNGETLKEVAEILWKSYTAKNVSNMFKVKVMEMLKERTNNKYGDLAISRHLEYLLEQKGIGFLKEVATRDGSKIVQISIGKYKDVMGHVQEMREKAKNAEASG